jgi:RNA exonuclease 4
MDSAVGRVTLVNWENQVVVDTFVKVPVRVTDYRTAETGITAQALCSEKARKLEDVRAKVGAIIKGKILIGHGLEVDLSALGMMHPWCDVRDTANYAPYMKQVIDPLSVMLLPRDLQGLASDVLDRDISERNGEPIEDAICCLDLYKAARSRWEAGLIRLVQQKEIQRGMLLSMRSMGKGVDHMGNPLSAIKEDELGKVMAMDAKQRIPPNHEQLGRCEYDESTIASTEPTTSAGLQSYCDDFSEASSFFSTESDSRTTWSSSSVSSFFRFGKCRSQIENLSHVVERESTPKGLQDRILTPARGHRSLASSSRIASEDASTVGSSSHGLWLPQSTSTRVAIRTGGWTPDSSDRFRQPQAPSNHDPTTVPVSSLTEKELRDHLPAHLWNDLCDGEDEALNVPRSRRESSSSHPVVLSDWIHEGPPEPASPPRQSSPSSWFRSRQNKSSPQEDTATADRRSEEQLRYRIQVPSLPCVPEASMARRPHVSRPEMRPFVGATASPQQELSGFVTATSEPTLVPDEEWLQEILQCRS